LTVGLIEGTISGFDSRFTFAARVLPFFLLLLHVVSNNKIASKLIIVLFIFIRFFYFQQLMNIGSRIKYFIVVVKVFHYLDPFHTPSQYF